MADSALPDCWPTPEQELLLEAALFNAARGRQSWQRWRAQASLVRLDAGSLGLLPLVYRNLQASSPGDATVVELKDIYISTLARNEFLTRRCGRVLNDLGESGVPTVLLKGGALVTRYYRDAGCRPMADLDVLVPRGQARTAFDVLERRGWRHAAPLSDGLLLDEKGAPFRHEAGFEIDLHWRALEEAPGLDADLWAAAQPFVFGGATTRVMDPADELLYACVHGLRWRDPSPVRWVADAHTIVRSTELDWTRLIRLAEAHRLSLPAAAALGYLKRRFEAPVSAHVVETLQAHPSTALERSVFRARMKAPRLRGLTSVMALHFQRYRRRVQSGLVPSGPRGFVASVARTWQLGTPARLPAQVVRRGWGRMRSLLSARTSGRGQQSL